MHCLELMKVLSIVGDTPRDLQEANQQVRSKPISKYNGVVHIATECIVTCRAHANM